MANIPISDGFGLDLQATLDPKSAFAKYFQHPPSFSVLQQNLASVQDVPLTGFPLKSTEIGLAFTQPTSVATTSPQFAGSAAVAATLCVVTGGKLFDPDPYGSPIEVPSGSAYLGLGVKATLAPGVDITSGKLAFGFTAGSTVCLSHYRLVATTPTTPTFKAALQTSLQDYAIPLSPDDFASLGIGDLATIEGTGSLQLTGTFDLLTSVNPLVSVTSAALPATVQIQEGAKIAISACLTITGDLQIRIQKVDAQTVRMGFYRKRGGDLTVQVNPSVGITAGTTSVDFISAVLGVVGPNPLPSSDQLEKAGLAKEKQDSIERALKAGIQRSLQLSIQEELLASSSQEVAFLYEISLNDLGPDGRNAIQDALRLNLSTLSESPQSLPRGIREIQNVVTTTRTIGQSLKLNLLGIYNFTSVSDLVLKGAVLTDPASGEILITDTATANQVSGAINFLANPDKLRKVLAQSFLITAAYRCSGLIAHPPSLKASYWHFDEHAQTDRATMTANIHVLSTMGLISAAQEGQSLALGTDFGHSTFYVTTDYNDALSQGLFLSNDGQPRARSEYEQIGRKAMQLLIQPGGDDDFRLRPLQDDAIWQQVQATGGTLGNLAELFPDLSPDSQIPIIAGDYVLIAWWASTMANMGQSLSAAKRFFSSAPPPSSDSPAFAKVQSDLWHQMADVARNTHDRFSDPWGLLAMDLASGQKSVASARIVSAGLTLNVKRTQPS
ncbi:MAG: hypothetical protein ACLQVG_10995 [Terriglobia bacterium]